MIRPERDNNLVFSVFNNNCLNNDCAVGISSEAHSCEDFHIFTGWVGNREARMYKDGVLVNSARGFPPRCDRSTSMNFIGRNCWEVNRWGDSLLTAEVRQICIWQQALTEAQLAQLHGELGVRWNISTPGRPARVASVAAAPSQQPPEQPTGSSAHASLDCAICLNRLRDPVFVDTGMTYCRPCITEWFATGHATCPATRQVLQSQELKVNWLARGMLG
jgi:hypothetical protein